GPLLGVEIEARSVTVAIRIKGGARRTILDNRKDRARQFAAPGLGRGVVQRLRLYRRKLGPAEDRIDVVPGRLEEGAVRFAVADHAGEDLQRAAFDIAGAVERRAVEAEEITQIAGREPLEDDPVGVDVGMWVLRCSRVMRQAAARQHDGAAAFALDGVRQCLAKREAALR